MVGWTAKYERLIHFSSHTFSLYGTPSSNIHELAVFGQDYQERKIQVFN